MIHIRNLAIFSVFSFVLTLLGWTQIAQAGQFKYECLCPARDCGGAERLRVQIKGSAVVVQLASIDYEVSSEEIPYRVAARSRVNPVTLIPTIRSGAYTGMPVLHLARELFNGGIRYRNGYYGGTIGASETVIKPLYGTYRCIRQ